MPKCPPTGGVRLQEVSVSGGSTVNVKLQQDYPWQHLSHDKNSDFLSELKRQLRADTTNLQQADPELWSPKLPKVLTKMFRRC